MARHIALALLIVLSSASTAFAQSLGTRPASEILLSWRSNALSPAGYEGRVATPIGGSVLLIADALVSGRPADLRGYEIRWYVDGELYDSGFGMLSTTYRVPELSIAPEIEVRVEIVDAPFAASEASTIVPFEDPQVVIEAPGGAVLRSGENVFVATPYSFNVASANDLRYTWTVDGEFPELNENPRELRIDVQGIPADAVDLGISVENTRNSGEGFNGGLTLRPAR